jgi:WD40 repeat protein
MSDPVKRPRPEDQALVEQLKSRMRELDQYIPPAPSFRRIEETVKGSPANSPRLVAPRLRPNFGAPLALVGIAVVAVLVLSSGLLRPRQDLGPAASPSPTTMGSVAVSTPTVAVSTPTVAVSTPTLAVPTPTHPLASGSPGPQVLLTGQVQHVAWSPAGTKIAVVEGASGEVTIMGVDGSTIRTVNAWDLAWIDDSSYVTTSGHPAEIIVGHVGSSAAEKMPGVVSGSIVASSAGVMALPLEESGSNNYVVWGAAGLSDPRDGVPVAFSPDGTLLAVVHYPRACCDGPPSPAPSEAPGPTTLDIVRTDTGESVRVTADVSWAYGALVSFSPDGRLVAFRMDPKDQESLERVGVLDVASGKVWVVDAGTVGSLTWTDSSHLLIGSMSPAASTPAGMPVTISYAPQDVDEIAVSSRGDVAMARHDASQVVIDRAGTQETIDLSGTRHFLAWSPDGSALIVICADNTSQTPDEVVLVRP